MEIIHQHYIVFKPYGFLSQFVNNQTKRKNKGMFGDLHDFPETAMVIGRLDADSEGLIFVTTDGMESHNVRSKKIEKEYYVQLDGLVTKEAMSQLSSGVEIRHEGKPYTTLPAKVKILDHIPVFPGRGKKIRDERHGPTTWVSIIICEGKNRQVRKMTAAAGFPTLRLVRVRIGNVFIKDMTSGQVIEVNAFDY
jgi:23S rRNA pseudouridine2457 synthase